jgi:EAL domain-containing protein (putative c-di-GMP-specific phosphodiesterase class I)/CheY-like chemotaxis protein
MEPEPRVESVGEVDAAGFPPRSPGRRAVDRALADALVLVVDDVAANVALLERILRSGGARNVYSFTDPEVFVASCADLEPDLVLLDLHMPKLDGFAVLDVLRATTPEDAFVPVLMLTADITRESRERALAAGVKDFVTKPFDRTEVLQRATNLLETRVLYKRLERRTARLEEALDAELAQKRSLATARRLKADLIRSVLESDEWSMVFQPIIDLQHNALVGAEALARFAVRPLRPPDAWFTEASDVGLGVELELAAVDRALADFPRLPPEVYLALNVSPATATGDGLRERLSAVPGARIVLELTEHHRVDDYETLWPALDELRAQGVRIAVDDAGSGYSGLQHILRLQPDLVKLDVELTRGLHADPVREALASSLVTFTEKIGAQLVAEGIESFADLETLRRLGVASGQGFLWGKPGPLPLMDTAGLEIR